MDIRLASITLCLLALLFQAPVAAQQSDEQLAAYYYDRGELAQAEQLYENLYSKSNSQYHYQRLLSTYLGQEHYKEARRLVERRQKQYPKDLSTIVDEGFIHQNQKQEKKALKCYDRAIESIGADQQPVSSLAQAFIRAGRNDYAVRTYLTARRHSRNRTLYFTEVTALYQQMGNYEAMTAEHFDLLDSQPAMLSSVEASLQRAMQEAPDNQLADGIRKAVVSRVRENPDNRIYLDLAIWFALQQKDFRFALEQAEATNARFPDQGSSQLMKVARIAEQNGNFEVAADGYILIQKKGKDDPLYFDARVGELEVDYARASQQGKIDAKGLARLSSKYLSAFEELGRNERTVSLMRHYAELIAYHGGNTQEAVDVLDDILEMKRLKPQIRDEVKLELADLLLFAGQTWDASLLYMQVERSNRDDRLGAEAKFRNARLSYFTHNFQWAKSQLDVLRGSTSKLIANDAMQLSLLISDNMEDDSTFTTLAAFADADLLLYQGHLDSAWAGFDAVSSGALSHPLLDEVLLRKAQIRIKQCRYDEADSLLERLVAFFPSDITADDALFLRAELNEQYLHRPNIAQQCYEKLLLEYPSSLYSDQARKRYRKQTAQ